MMRDSDWKLFSLGDERYFKIKKGKRLTKNDMSQGETPYIGAIDNNNGVTAYIDKAAIFKKNSITVNYNGSVAWAFYHNKDYWASDDCNVIESDYMTPAVGLFLCTIIKNERYRFNYGRKWHKARMEESKINLPSTPEGEPDWKKMTSFFKMDTFKGPSEKPYHYKKVSLNDREWRIFSCKDIFVIEKGERLTKVDQFSGKTPLITATNNNNGVSAWIDKTSHKPHKKIFKNKITLDMFFQAHYQPEEYFSDDNVHTLVKNEETPYFSAYIGLFVATILNANKYKYAYGRQLRIHRLRNEKIKLPVSLEGKPDWNFMEYYIKALPYSSNLKEEKGQPVADKQIFDSLINKASTPV